MFKIIKNNIRSPYVLMGAGLLTTVTILVVFSSFIKPVVKRNRRRRAEEVANFISTNESKKKNWRV